MRIMSPDIETRDTELTYDTAKEEKYEHFVDQNKHLVYELKLGVILIIGGIIILVCIVYIIYQCKRKHSRSSKQRNNDHEKFKSRQASVHLIHVHTSGRGKEFFL